MGWLDKPPVDPPDMPLLEPPDIPEELLDILLPEPPDIPEPELAELLPSDPMPTVPEEPEESDDPMAAPVLIASNTDIPCGPMVMTTGLPSFDFACTTKDSATTFTSVKPALCRSCLIF